MPIYTPGLRDRHNRRAANTKRSVVMALSLTAMVDMFTVLAVFLLQNYETTGKAIEISDKVQLPKASDVSEIKPAHVVVVAKDSIQLDSQVVASFQQVKGQESWLIQNLQTRIQAVIKDASDKRHSGGIKQAVNSAKQLSDKEADEQERRITVQADKSIDFLTIKKVMYTLLESGASEVNFAVIKDDRK
jgi:biopolymer transport protein ExbD